MALIPSNSESRRQLGHAWHTVWMDLEALKRFGRTAEAFWQSFWCAVLMLPFYGLILAISGHYPASAQALSLPRLALTELSIYVILWTAWPVIMAGVCERIDRRDDYIPYIVANNWLFGIFTLLSLLLLTVKQLLNLTPIMDLFLSLSLFGWQFWIGILVAQHLLRQPIPGAILIVLANFILNLFILASRLTLLS